jgi:hypothetical protein
MVLKSPFSPHFIATGKKRLKCEANHLPPSSIIISYWRPFVRPYMPSWRDA